MAIERADLTFKIKMTGDGIAVTKTTNQLYAARLDFDIPQGVTFSLPITYIDDTEAPVDLSGHTASMKIRTHWDTTAALETLTDSDGITLTTSGPQNITIARTAAETAAYTFTRAVYDLELIDAASAVTRLLEGFVTLRKEVSS